MDAYGHPQPTRDRTDSPAADTDAADPTHATAPRGSGVSVRARLDGMPCLVAVCGETTVTGRLAVPLFAGERAPMPPRGRRATLEFVAAHSGAAAGAESDPPEPIEVMVSAADRRSGRFTARLLALSEDQSRWLGAVCRADHA